MQAVPYVSTESAERARSFEKRFQALPEMAGVVFVSVDAQPIKGGQSNAFKILLGVSKRLHESVGWGLIQQVMKTEIEKGAYTITASVFTGVSGACRDESAEGAHPSSATANEPS